MNNPNNIRVAILQSSYIPWKGYFDLIDSVDTFVLFDDVQYTRRDWRNRNLIKTKNGPLWLTIPVQVKGKFTQSIKETLVNDHHWAEEHLSSIVHHLGKARHYSVYEKRIADLYERAAKLDHLSEINHLFLENLCDVLKIETQLCWSSEFTLKDNKSERLLSICQQLGAKTYVSGPAAKSYLDCQIFEANGIAVEWFDYAGYPEYEQLYPPFDHSVTIIDLLANAGKDSRSYLNRQSSIVLASR